MDKDLKNQLQRCFRKSRPRMYLGRRHGKAVFMIKSPGSYKELKARYPKAVPSKTKSRLLKLFGSGYKNRNPSFSDVLDGIFKWLIR